jgi:hypothetical protein
MTRKKTSETEKRLRSILCDEPVEGFDLDEHVANIATTVSVARSVAANGNLAADLHLQAEERAS